MIDRVNLSANERAVWLAAFARAHHDDRREVQCPNEWLPEGAVEPR